MPRHYTKYTKEILEKAVKNSISMAEVCRKLGRVPAGGNYSHLWRKFDEFNIDTSHFLGQAHNRGKELVPFEELTKPQAIKNRLLKERGHSCWGCGLHTWVDKIIPLELDHIDGNNRNNSRENLRILCPNCHSLTPTYRNKVR